LFRWRFGDGSPISTADRPRHEYILPGGYRPALVVFDLAGRSAQSTRRVRARDQAGNAPPSLGIQTPSQLGDEALDAALSATVMPGTGTPGEVFWELGNGSVAIGSSVTGRYEAGRTWATATVVDGLGLPSTDKVEIAVRRSGRMPPFCAATADPPAAFLADATASVNVQWIGFRTPGSDAIASASWVIDGQPVSAGQTQIAYGVAEAGWHHGALTVVDQNGLQCTDSLWVLVGAPGGGGVVPPRILESGAGGPMQCNSPYTARAPIALGSGPLVWSLDATASPAGMTVDAATGVVTWNPDPLTATEISYVLVATTPGGAASDSVTITLPYHCESVSLGTCGGCGAGTGTGRGAGAPAVGLLLGLALWVMRRGQESRRRVAVVRVRQRAEDARAGRA
jgi:hypothetical protein